MAALRTTLVVLAVLIVAVLPMVAPTTQVLLTLALAKGLAVLGIVVLLQAGQVSFGHALYFAVSAYAAAFFGRLFGNGEVITMIIAGTAASLVIGLLVGLFVVRYRHIFFGMLNLAISMIFYSILEKFYHVTGGADGLSVPRPSILGIEVGRENFETVLFYGTLVICLVAAGLTHRFLSSPIGNMMRAIKTNEVRLEYLGVSARGTLLVGYVVSAGLCGLGGALMAVAQGIVTPEYAWWVRSGEFVFIAILGGAGSVGGAFIGALIYEAVRAYAAAFAADVWQMVLGIVLLVVILFAPGGIVGMFRSLFANRAARGKTGDDAATARAGE